MPAVMNTMCAPCSASAMRLALLHGEFPGLLGLAAGAEARPELQFDVGAALLERLRVGIAADEFDAADTFADHVLDRVAARAAHADDLDDRRVASRLRCPYFLEFKHFSPPEKTNRFKNFG
jgi:hypothetical protein